MTRIAILLAFAVGGCVSSPHEGLASSSSTFDPVAFFAGRTEGEGTLRIILSRARLVRVYGRGTIAADGALVLDQDVNDGRTVKHRRWRIRRTGVGSYTGSLTDARGAVTGEQRGNALHLTFAMKGGLAVEQWLYLQPGGEIALNRMTVRKFGLTLARLSETIRRSPG